VRFAAAFTALIAGRASSVLAEGAGREAVAGARRLAGEPNAGQRHSYEAAGKSFEGLSPRYGLGHTFNQLIEFVVHNVCVFPFMGFWARAYDA